MSRVRGGFPSSPAYWLLTTTMSPAQKENIRVRDDDYGAALHCIRSTSCHQSPGSQRKVSGAMQCEELSQRQTTMPSQGDACIVTKQERQAMRT